MEKFRPTSYLKYFYYRLRGVYSCLLQILFPPDEVNPKDIPVIINNFNRYDTMLKLVNSLEKRGYRNIRIIDNNSSNPVLLEYYKQCRYKVYRLNENLGSSALWLSGIFKEYKRNYFVYTDPDMVLIDEVPDDFMQYFLDILKRHKLAQKAGFSLKIDDLPDHYLHKQQVIESEGNIYKYYIESEKLYRAPIATTFALYKPRAVKKHANNYMEMYRTAYPYMAIHLPWYQDSLNPDDDERYYLEHLDSGYWYSSRNKKTLESS